MRLAWIGWLSACVLACGGGSFSAGTPDDAGPRDAPSDAPIEGAAPDASSGDAGLPLRCGPAATCDGATPVCCASPQPVSFTCAHDNCGCQTQLACRRKDDCPGTQVCCIDQSADNCSSQHYVAGCKDVAQCLPPSRVLCDPGAATPCGALQCRSDPSTVQQVNLPPNEGFGLCGT